MTDEPTPAAYRTVNHNGMAEFHTEASLPPEHRLSSVEPVFRRSDILAVLDDGEDAMKLLMMPKNKERIEEVAELFDVLRRRFDDEGRWKR